MSRIRRLTRVADMRGEGFEPRLGQVLVDHLEQRPYRALGQPRIRVWLGVRSGRYRGADQSAWRRELDIGADAVRPARPSSEAA